jgi:hypothetical protein
MEIGNDEYGARIYLTEFNRSKWPKPCYTNLLGLHYCVYVFSGTSSLSHHPNMYQQYGKKLSKVYISSDFIILHDLQPSIDKYEDGEYVNRKVPKNIGEMLFSSDPEILTLGKIVLSNHLQARELEYYNKLKK